MIRRIRSAAAFALLAMLAGACQMTIDVTARLNEDGSGRFTVAFAFDKEFVDVVRSSERGKESLNELATIGATFENSGWTVRQSQPDGGLRLNLSRTFRDPAELERSIREIAQRSTTESLSFLSIFRDFRIGHSSGLFNSSANVSGVADLSPERLAPGAELTDDVRAALALAAKDVFRYRIAIEMPGRVGDYDGNPDSVAGGTIVWTVPFGQSLDFAASSQGLRTGRVVLASGGGAVVLIALGAWLLLRRRRRDREVVPGWDVAEPAGDAPRADAAPAEVPAADESSSEGAT